MIRKEILRRTSAVLSHRLPCYPSIFQDISKLKKMERGSLSLFDRIQFGAIAAFFGLIVGSLIALIIIGFSYGVLEDPRPYNLWLVWFSGTYFFVVGVFRGAEAAETIVDGLVASAAVVLGGIGIAGGGQTVDGDFKWRRGMLWSVTFFLGVALVAWFG